MKTNEQLMNNLRGEIQHLDDLIKNREKYNERNLILRKVTLSSIYIVKCIPFIISSFMCFDIVSKGDNIPLSRNKIMVYASILSIDTSTGIHLEKISFDKKYKEQSIEFSTGYVLNNNNLYERTVTTYKISDSVDLNDIDSILSLTKEELDKILVINNITTIKKNTLDEEDDLYKDDAVIVTNHYQSDEIAAVQDEEIAAVIFHSLIYLILTFFSGGVLNLFINNILKFNFYEKLKLYCEQKFKYITMDEIVTLKEILKLKRKNLELLEGTELNECPHSLRKKRG